MNLAGASITLCLCEMFTRIVLAMGHAKDLNVHDYIAGSRYLIGFGVLSRDFYARSKHASAINFRATRAGLSY